MTGVRLRLKNSMLRTCARPAAVAVAQQRGVLVALQRVVAMVSQPVLTGASVVVREGGAEGIPSRRRKDKWNMVWRWYLCCR